MIPLSQAIALGLLQGVTELFPISSLGHSILLPGLFHWDIDERAGDFLSFLVATHFATALVLFLIYRKDWTRIITGLVASVSNPGAARSNLDARLGWLLIAGTVPAGLVGLLFEKQVRLVFLSPRSAALFLALNGVLLFLAEWLRRTAKTGGDVADADRRIATELGWSQAIRVGVMQILALIPGFSRTGATLAGGLLVGLTHEDALRFSFLLATPIIGAAALLKVPKLLASGNGDAIVFALTGGVAAAVAAYASVKFLTRYFKTKTLVPFGIYCIALGATGLAFIGR